MAAAVLMKGLPAIESSIRTRHAIYSTGNSGKLVDIGFGDMQVYSVELLGVLSQACKRQLDIIHSVLASSDQPQPQPKGGQQQQGPRLLQPLQCLRAVFILLQNPLNGKQ